MVASLQEGLLILPNGLANEEVVTKDEDTLPSPIIPPDSEGLKFLWLG